MGHKTHTHGHDTWHGSVCEMPKIPFVKVSFLRLEVSQKARVVSDLGKMSDSEGGGGYVCWSVPSGVIVFILRNDLLQVCGSGMRHTRNHKVSLKPTLGTTNGTIGILEVRSNLRYVTWLCMGHTFCLKPQLYECGAYYSWV